MSLINCYVGTLISVLFIWDVGQSIKNESILRKYIYKFKWYLNKSH